MISVGSMTRLASPSRSIRAGSAGAGPDLDRDTGRLRRQAADERSDQQQHAVIGAADRDRALVGTRVEADPRVQGALDDVERLPDRLHQRFCACRRHQRRALANEQRVVEQLPQPGQRAAHAGLAEPYPGGGAGDVPLGEQGVKRNEQVEVDASQVHEL